MRDRTYCFLVYLDLVIIEWCVNWIYFPRVNNCYLCGCAFTTTTFHNKATRSFYLPFADMEYETRQMFIRFQGAYQGLSNLPSSFMFS